MKRLRRRKKLAQFQVLLDTITSKVFVTGFYLRFYVSNFVIKYIAKC